MNQSFIEGTILLKIKPTKSVILKAIPETILSDKSIEFLLINCPCFDSRFFIYAFTVPIGMCYCMVFPFDGNCYMIAIISNQIIPHLFCSFLNDAHKDFVQVDEPVVPENQLDYIYAILKSWDLQLKISNPFNKAKVINYWNQESTTFTLLSSTHKYVIDSTYFSFQHYNPFLLFSDENKIIRAWHSVLKCHASTNFPIETNIEKDESYSSSSHSAPSSPSLSIKTKGNQIAKYQSVLVLSKSKEQLLFSVFGVASLVFPFHFKGTILITTSPFDLRLKHCEGYDIVGITDEILNFIPHFDQQFSVVLRSDPNNYGNPVCESSIQERNGTVGKVLLYMMDLVLNSNPFNDIFDNDYIPENLEKLLDSLNPIPKESRVISPFSVTADELKEIANSITIKSWRKRTLYRSSFRNSFLASTPKEVIPKLTPEQLNILPNVLKDLKEKYKDDLHMSSVIKRYKQCLKELANQ